MYMYCNSSAYIERRRLWVQIPPKATHFSLKMTALGFVLCYCFTVFRVSPGLKSCTYMYIYVYTQYESVAHTVQMKSGREAIAGAKRKRA